VRRSVCVCARARAGVPARRHDALRAVPGLLATCQALVPGTEVVYYCLFEKGFLGP